MRAVAAVIWAWHMIRKGTPSGVAPGAKAVFVQIMLV